MLSPYHPLQLALGLIVWAIWFSLTYGALSIACVLAPPPAELGAFTWINGVLLIIALAATGLLLFWAHRCWRTARQGRPGGSVSQRMIPWLGVGVHLAGAIATLGVGLTLLFLPPCL